MTNDGWLMIVYGSSYYLDPAIAILPSYLGTVMTHCGMGTPTNQPVQWMAVKSTVLQDTKKMYSTERHSMVVPTTRGHLHLVPFLYDSLYTYIYIIQIRFYRPFTGECEKLPPVFQIANH